MEYKSTNRWIDCIEQAMKIYLSRKHSTIKMSPLEAEKPINESKVRQNLTIFFSKNSRLKPQKQKFQVGDKVRVWKFHRTFKRGYDHNFTDEYFVIHKVLKNLPVIRYKLKDFNGDKIIGSYFQEELVLYTPKSFYKINIIGEKGQGKAKKFLVNWDGWPAIYNQWILASEIENLETNNTQNLNDVATLNNTSDETQIQSTLDDNEFTIENEGVADGESKDFNSNSLEKKTKKVYVGFINDDNIPDIIEKKRIKRNNRKVIKENDKNILSFMEKKINKKKIDTPKPLNNKKILKVNVINDEHIKFIKQIKRK